MKLIKKYKYLITIIIVILIIIYIFLIKNKLNKEKYTNLNTETNILLEEPILSKSEEEEEMCTIDIKGAINNPGVYLAKCTSTVNDIIKLAGNLTTEADTSVINLAKKVYNEMVIIIYTKEEVKNSNIVDTVIKVVEQECKCPNIQNDSCINTEIKDQIGNNSLININTATIEELQELPGVGESKAKAIIEYREQNGAFTNIEELLNVSGIGDNLYEQIKTYITT